MLRMGRMLGQQQNYDDWPPYASSHQLTIQLTNSLCFWGLRYERLDAAGPKKECTHRRELGAVCVPVMNSQFCSSAVLQVVHLCKLCSSASSASSAVLQLPQHPPNPPHPHPVLRS
jgi:hypothetical protein